MIVTSNSFYDVPYIEHHCVRPNEKDDKGNKLLNLNNEHIGSVADAVERMVYHLRSSLAFRDFVALDDLD